jgi:hypothetical protein
MVEMIAEVERAARVEAIEKSATFAEARQGLLEVGFDVPVSALVKFAGREGVSLGGRHGTALLKRRLRLAEGTLAAIMRAAAKAKASGGANAPAMALGRIEKMVEDWGIDDAQLAGSGSK